MTDGKHYISVFTELNELKKEIERLTECLKIRTSECRNYEAKINSEVLAEREECAKIADYNNNSGVGRMIAAAIRNQKP